MKDYPKPVSGSTEYYLLLEERIKENSADGRFLNPMRKKRPKYVHKRGKGREVNVATGSVRTVRTFHWHSSQQWRQRHCLKTFYNTTNQVPLQVLLPTVLGYASLFLRINLSPSLTSCRLRETDSSVSLKTPSLH